MIGEVDVGVDVDVGVVSSMIGEVGSGSGIMVDPRCLLSHSATAVTPSCQES